MSGSAGVERPTKVADLSDGVVEYRLERRGPRAVLMMHGGHMRASLPLGEEVFADAGYTVLAPSRPGYGRTPITTGISLQGFAEVAAELCHQLGIGSVAAVVGQSAGGPSAVTMAAHCPALVERLILQSAVGPLAWPDRRTQLGSRVVFSPHTEHLTWALIHTLVRRTPATGLRLLLRGLSLQSAGAALSALAGPHRALAAALFERMRSGSGFRADLRNFTDITGYRRTAASVGQAALVIASPADGAVPFAHARALADALPNARLIASRASGHFIWFGDDYPAIAATITSFLEADPAASSPMNDQGRRWAWCPVDGGRGRASYSKLHVSRPAGSTSPPRGTLGGAAPPGGTARRPHTGCIAVPPSWTTPRLPDAWRP